MAAVPPANGSSEVLYPLGSNGRPSPLSLIERNELNKVLAGERRAKPIAVFPTTARHDWLVHQVVAKDGRARLTLAGDQLPEAGLRVPAIFLRQLVVPARHILLVVAA